MTDENKTTNYISNAAKTFYTNQNKLFLEELTRKLNAIVQERGIIYESEIKNLLMGGNYNSGDYNNCAYIDMVNHPPHYTQGRVECIDAIESATVNKMGMDAIYVGNVIKYLWRYENKNGSQDIEKAMWYLKRLLEYVKVKEEKENEQL